jgi:hypothetical protein
MLFERQRLLLTLLDALGGSAANTDFQKLLFVYTQTEQSPTYEFVPYKFGAFSFTSFESMVFWDGGEYGAKRQLCPTMC